MRVRRAGAGDTAAIEALYRELVPGDPNIRVAPEHVARLQLDPHDGGAQAGVRQIPEPPALTGHRRAA